MKTFKSFLFIAVLSNVLFSSCGNSKRDLYPEDLIGGFELLSAEKTGIDFNNAIKESETLNHIYYSFQFLSHYNFVLL